MRPLGASERLWGPYLPRSYLRLFDVVVADDLIMVLFGHKGGDGSVYLYAENFADYEASSPLDPHFAVTLFTAHMDEFLGRGGRDSPHR